MDDNVSASNRISICETHFGLQQMHNPNMSILSPGDSFAERVLFFCPVVGEDKKLVLNPLPVALPKHGMGLVFWVMLLEIVGYMKFLIHPPTGTHESLSCAV